MTVQILDQGPVCDGYDVAVRLADGRLRTFHFLAAPANAQGACDALEASVLAREADEAATDDWQIMEA